MEFFSNLNAQVSEVLGPLGLIIIAGVLGFVLVAITVIAMLKQPEDPLNKLKRASNGAAKGKDKGQQLRQGDRNAQLQKFAKFLEPEDVAEMSAMQLMLRQAGYASRDAVRFFHFAQLALGLVGLAIGIVYTNFLGGGEGLSTQKMMMWTVGPGAVGYYLPKYWVTRRVAARKDEITAGFPDALDMMLVCVDRRLRDESGQGQDDRSQRHGRTLRRAGRVVFRDRSGPIGGLWYVHLGRAAGLCG